MSRRIEVEMELDGARLDRALAVLCPDLSRRSIRRLIQAGAVFLNRKRCRVASRTVGAGDSILVEKESGTPSPAEYPLTILWRNEAIMALDKPAGLPFAPTRSGVEGTLLYSLARSLSLPLVEIHPVHRLDTPTSGVVLVALSRGAAEHLGKAFRERKVTKRYLAWVEGAPSPASGAWTKALTSAGGRTRVDPEGRSAVTEYRTSKRRLGFSLLELGPRTGRMHQIRVHCSDAGHPIVGDRKYGSEIYGPQRALLHSWKIRFPLLDGTLQEVVSPVPPDIEEFPSLIPWGEGAKDRGQENH